MRTSASPQRPGLKGHAEATRLSPDALVTALRGLLGARLVAYLGSVRETRAVRQWSEGVRQPSSAVVQRLRIAYQVAALLAERDDPTVVQAWFQGLNPQLDDRAPARVLRDENPDEAGPAVMAAARAFVAAG
jgi:hypothetical protein